MRSLLAAVLFVFPLAVPAQGMIIERPCREPVRRCPPVGARVERLSSDVRVRLDGRVLHFEIDEEFINRGGLIGEADYLFPMPAGAAFQDLALEINGEMTTGETMDAGEARRIYEEIVRRQKDPALVEWMGQGLLRTRIFPIQPGERKRVQVRYQMVAQREGDAVRIDHFRGGVTHSGVETGRRPEGRVRFTLRYPQSADYGRAYSPTHELRLVERGREVVAEVRGDAREVTVLLPVRRARRAAITVLPHANGGEDGFVLITLAPPALPPRVTPRDVTFVLDVSGSMRGRKMEQARAAGKQLLETLSPSDRFRIIDFASTVGSFRNGFVAAVIALVVIAIPLAWTGVQRTAEWMRATAGAPYVRAWIGDRDLTVREWSVEGETVSLLLAGPDEPGDAAELAQDLATAFGGPVTLAIDYTPTQREQVEAAP